MPIYEFYCPDCHTVFSFLSRRSDTTRQPACPRCKRKRLERKVSRFAVSKGRAEPVDGEGPGEMDEGRMEQAMAEIAQEVEGIDESDPRQMARVMRKLFTSMGQELGPGMEEAVRRMEDGEDPDKVEEEMGDLLGDEEAPLAEGPGRLKRLRRRLAAPRVDETLYEM